MGYVLNQGFWSNRIVSKLVAAIAYETHYRAAKVERTCVFGSMIGHESLMSESKDFGTIIRTILKLTNIILSLDNACYRVAVVANWVIWIFVS